MAAELGMHTAARGPKRSATARRLGLVSDALLVVSAGLFFYIHAARTLDGHYSSLPFACEQGILVVVCLFRRGSLATSTRPFDWMVAAGGWLPLLARPADGAPDSALVAGVAMQSVALVVTCLGFLSLGRSFGVVAANRGLRVGGLYRVVRHPIYLSHMVSTTGFLVANPSALNAAVVLGAGCCQILRIHAEERMLSQTADYSTYRERVRWRLLPGLY